MPRFLVVDDDHSTVRAMTHLLIEDGHIVSPFTEGAHAVDALSREAFDVVITDLDMPRMDGHEVVRAARESQPAACLVVASGRGPDVHGALSEAGACFIVDKPVAYADVVQVVADCRARGGRVAHGACHMRSKEYSGDLVPLRRR